MAAKITKKDLVDVTRYIELSAQKKEIEAELKTLDHLKEKMEAGETVVVAEGALDCRERVTREAETKKIRKQLPKDADFLQVVKVQISALDKFFGKDQIDKLTKITKTSKSLYPRKKKAGE